MPGACASQEHYRLEGKKGLLIRWDQAIWRQAEQGSRTRIQRSRPPFPAWSLLFRRQPAGAPVLPCLPTSPASCSWKTHARAWTWNRSGGYGNTSGLLPSRSGHRLSPPAELDEIFMAADRVLVFFNGVHHQGRANRDTRWTRTGAGHRRQRRQRFPVIAKTLDPRD